MKERDTRRKQPKKEPKDGEVTKLKTRIRRLEKDNKQLKSELRSYDQVFKRMNKHIGHFTDEFSLEELIDAAKETRKPEKKSEKSVKNVCVECGSSDVFVGSLPFGKLHSCRVCAHVRTEKDD